MVVQSNYDDYKIAKMKHTPEIKVSIVKSSLPPAGIARCCLFHQLLQSSQQQENGFANFQLENKN